jgi:hypothetical protein
VEDRFKLLFFMAIREYSLTDEGAIEMAVSHDAVLPEGFPDFIKGGLSRFDQLVSQPVCINDRDAQ